MSQVAGFDMVQKIKPDIIGHITGGPIPMPEEDMIRIANETECFMEICTSGNYRLALSLARAVKAKAAIDRVLIGTDTPGGTGIVPRGILREIAFISSVGEIAPEKAICMATGNVGRAHDLNLGILEEGRPADIVLMHKITGSVSKDALDSFRQRRSAGDFLRDHRRRRAGGRTQPADAAAGAGWRARVVVEGEIDREPFEFGVGLFPTEPLQKMIHLAKVSEEVGFSHIWVGDSHLIWREAYINMAAMMLNTTKVKLGTGVTNPLTRHPSVVASGYATLEEYSPGRMIVGIGLGDSSVETMGMKPSTLANFEKSLQQMRELFAGKEAELPTGKIHLLHPCKSKVPIYIAASGPKMLELSRAHRRRHHRSGRCRRRLHRSCQREDRRGRESGGTKARRYQLGSLGSLRGFRNGECEGRGQSPCRARGRASAALRARSQRTEGS